MTAYKKKLQIINTREPFSLKFKSILCFRNSSKYISPILQIFNDSRNISLFRGINPQNSIKRTFLEINHVNS